MKKITAIIAAALIALSVSMPVFAVPDDSSAVDSSAAAESSTESQRDESSKEESGREESSKKESSKEESSKKESSKEESGKKESSSEKTEIKLDDYRIEEAEMQISIPDDMYVLTRDMPEDSPVLKANKLTKKQVQESFEKNNTYLNASTKDYSYDITVTVVENEDTKTIGSLSDLSDSELQKLTDNLLESKVFNGCSRTNYQNTLFLTLTFEQDISNSTICGIQEYTIVKGRCVKITFQSYSGDLDEAQKDIFTKVMNSVVFDGIDPIVYESSVANLDVNGIDIRYIYIIAAAVIGLIALFIMIVVGIKYRKSKAVLPESEPEEDEKPERVPVRLAPEEKTDVEGKEENELPKEASPWEPEPGKEHVIPRLDDEKDTDTSLNEFIFERINVTETPDLEATMEIPALEELERMQSETPDGFVEIQALPVNDYQGGYSSSFDSDVHENDEYDEEEVVFAEETAPRKTEIKQISSEDPDTELTVAGEQHKADIKPMTAKTHDIKPVPAKAPEIKPAVPVVVPAVIKAEQKPEEAVSAVSEKPAVTEPEKPAAAEHEKPVYTVPEKPAVAEHEKPVSTETEKPAENEPSAYEQRFGKNRTVPPVSPAYVPPEEKPASEVPAAAPENTSKFEEHFGKLNSAARPEEKTEEKPVTEKAEVSADEAQQSAEETSDSLFNQLIDKLRSSDQSKTEKPEEKTETKTAEMSEDNGKVKDVSKSVPAVNTLTYSAVSETQTAEEIMPDLESENDIYKSEEPETKTEEKKPVHDSGKIELEISKSADGSLVIGALNEASGKPIDIEIRDASNFKEERDKKMAALGLETARENEIYNANAIDNEENPFKVRTKDASGNTDTSGSKTDKPIGQDKGENTGAGTDEKVHTKKEDTLKEGSAFEKRFGRNMNTGPAVTEANAASAQAAAGAVTAATAGTAAVAAVFDKASEAKGKKYTDVPANEAPAEASPAVKEAPTKPETVEEFLDGARTMTIVPEEDKKDEAEDLSKFNFERDSGIIFEHPLRNQPAIVPMNTVFTVVPRLESVNAEQYHKRYDDIKSTMTKNQAYAQRFGNSRPVQPFVETPKPITKPEPQKKEEKTEEKHKKSKFGKHKNSEKKDKKNAPAIKLKEEDKIEYYTGYEKPDSDPFGVSMGSDDIIIEDHKKKNTDSVGTRFKKSLGKIFAPETPEDEQ